MRPWPSISLCLKWTRCWALHHGLLWSCRALLSVKHSANVLEASQAAPGLTTAFCAPSPPVPPADKVNRESVRSIQKSIFVVCLDAPMPRVSEDVYRSQVAGQMLHGGGSKLNSGNRWFDKTLQVRTWQGLDSQPRQTPTLGSPTASGLPASHAGVPGLPAHKSGGSHQLDATVITGQSACHYWAWPRNCCHLQHTPSVHGKEPGMRGRAERHSLGRGFPPLHLSR